MPSKTSQEIIERIILDGTTDEKRFLFAFNKTHSNEEVLAKFKLFARANFIRYFKSESAPFHDEMVLNFIKSYRGENYVNLAFRGSSKTSLAKIFLCFILLNDEEHLKKYIKVLSRDFKNPKQIVTDIYNYCIDMMNIYGDMFEKSGEKKREERMDSFTLRSGVKVTAGTMGQSQRGHVQDAYRPDWIWFEDIEDRESISSQPITEGIIANCDEAILGLDKSGSWLVTGNYISENGVIQWFIDKKNRILQIVPILDSENRPTWNAYTLHQINQLKEDSEDFYGEYMCDPSRSEGKFFDVNRIEEDMKRAKKCNQEIGDTKYWFGFMAHHRYGLGADTAEGVGLDSNALAVFDFTTGDLAATSHSSNIKPELFAYEIARVATEFGRCIAAPEINNMSGGIVIVTLKNIYENIYRDIDRTKYKETESAKLGWHTNARTKPQMFMDFRRDYNDGIVHIHDMQVLKEMKSYTNNDITEREAMITRHFDLLTAVVIAWQMKSNLKASNEAVVTVHET